MCLLSKLAIVFEGLKFEMCVCVCVCLGVYVGSLIIIHSPKSDLYADQTHFRGRCSSGKEEE